MHVHPPAFGPSDRAPTRLAVAAVVLVALVVRAMSVRHSFFSQDDLVYMRDAQTLGVTGDWLFKTWFGHLAPLHRLSFSVLSPTSTAWTELMAVQLSLVAMSCGAFYLTLERLFGPSWRLVPAVAWLAFSTVLQMPLVWPSAGIQQIPDLAANLLALYAYVRYRETRGASWGLLGPALVAVSLLFYIRPLLVPVYLAALHVLLLQDAIRPGAVLRSLWRDRLVWGAYVVVGVVYLVFYVRSGAPGGDELPGLQALGQFVRIFWLRTVSFSMVGADVPDMGEAITGWSLAVQLLAQVVVVGLVVWSVARRPAAVRAWIFLAFALAVSAALLAYGRVAALGPGIALDLRYFTNVPWLFALAVLFAFAPRRASAGAADASARVAAAPTLTRVRGPVATRAAVGLALTATLAYAAGATVTNAHVQKEWFGTATREWAEHLDASVESVPGDGPLATLGGVVPGYVFVAAPDRASYATLAQLGPLFQPRLAFGRSAGPRYVIDDDGTLRPGLFVTEAAVRAWGGEALRRRGAVPSHVVPVGGGRSACFRPSPSRAAQLEIVPEGSPLPATVGGQVVRVEVPERLRPQGAFNVYVDSGGGYAEPPRRLTFPSGSRTAVVDLGVQALTRLRIDVRGAQRLCVSRVTFGRFVAR